MSIANPTYYTVKGSSDIIRLPDKRTWNLNDGVQTFKRFQGTDDAIKAKFNELSSGVDDEGAPVDTGIDDLNEDIDGKVGRLLARVIEDSGGSAGSNTEALNAVWEVIANDILKPIETHSYFDAITAERKRYVEDAARNADALDAAATDTEKILYTYYSVQMLDYILTEFIIRKSTVVSSRSAITASYTDTNRVVTLASIGPPSALLGSLTSLPKGDGTSGAWEWLKKAPQVRQISRRKFQISYEWHGAERWSLRFYGGTWVPLYE